MIGDSSNSNYYEDNPIQTMDSSTLFSKTFFWMFLGLLGTGLVAAYSYFSGMLEGLIMGGFFPIIAIIEVVVVLVFSLLFKRLSPTTVGILYFAYAFINGLTFSTIFYAYELSSITYLFVVCALIFGGLAFWGYTAKRDLSRLGTLFTAMLLGGLILSLINLFLRNSMLDIILNWVILLVFFGITAYDMNKLKALAQDPELDREKIAIYCAMQLYLDFINIFLRILAIFGKRRD